MEEPTRKTSERLKDQSKDEMKISSEVKIHRKHDIKKPSEIKIKPKGEMKKSSDTKSKLKDEMNKIPEIKVQPVKSLKEPNNSERTKNFISRNVAINRSFNSNSKLELLR